MSDTDLELLERYKRHQAEDAFAEIVRRHLDLVHSAALRQVRSAQLAEEVAQSTFLTLAHHAHRLAPDTILTAWLYQVTRRQAIDVVRREARRQLREQIATEMNVMNATAADWTHIEPLLDDAMHALDETDRAAILLRYFESKSLREVGATLGASENAAQKRLSRAIERLREFFSKRGVSVGASGLVVVLSANAVQAAPAGLAQTVTTAAVASGAMVAGSTSTLIPGALKLVASAKIKTTTVVIAAVLLVIGASGVILHAVHTHRTKTPRDIQGFWEGVAGLPGVAGIQQGEEAKTRVLFRFFKTNGAYTAVSDLLDTAPHHIEATEFVYEPPLVRFKGSLNESFQGTLNAGATEISGSARVGDISLPLLLRRTSKPAAVPVPLTESDHAPRTGSDLQGTWRGTLGNGARAVRVVAKIAEPASGTYRAELDNETGAWLRQPMSVTYNQPELSLRVSSGAGMFQGTLNSDHTEMVGNWLQGGRRTPARFWRED